MIDAALSRPVPEMSLAEVIRGYYYWKRQARSGVGSATEIATEFRQELRRRGAPDDAEFAAQASDVLPAGRPRAVFPGSGRRSAAEPTAQARRHKPLFIAAAERNAVRGMVSAK